jgi:hypothetical protein
MRLKWDPMKTPNSYHMSLMVYLKKITIGYNWTKNDIHVMHDNMTWIQIFHGSWHICKVNFVDPSITTCEICDIYYRQFCTDITTLCWFYYITYYHMKNHIFLSKNASINAPSFGLVLISNVNISVPLPHQQTWILDITLLWHHLNIYSCQSLWSTLKIVGVGCWEMEMYQCHLMPLTNWASTYTVFLRHFTKHWGWCSWLHGLALMVCPKLHKFWQS